MRYRESVRLTPALCMARIAQLVVRTAASMDGRDGANAPLFADPSAVFW